MQLYNETKIFYGVLFILICALIFHFTNSKKVNDKIKLSLLEYSLPFPSMTPWTVIGGCGAGGGSGGGGAGKAKWIGRGLEGYLLDIEVMSTTFTGQNFRLQSYTPRIGWMINQKNRLGITVPYVSNCGSLQPATNYPLEEGVVTGGLSDISLDYSFIFGASGEYTFTAGIGLPTGQFDIKRGSDKFILYLPQNLQKGSGVYQPSLGLSYAQDLNDNFLLLSDIGYSHPFAYSFSGKNNKYDLVNRYPDSLYAWQGDTVKNKKRFRYHFKPYGENDLGAYFPPSLSCGVYIGYKQDQYFVHSLGLTFSVPIGVAWVASTDYGTSYNPQPDPDHQAWSGSFVYGLQCSKFEWLPLFFAITIPVHDQSPTKSGTSHRHWDAPDYNDLGQQLKVTFGLKAGLY